MRGLFFLFHFSQRGTASSIQNLRLIDAFKDSDLDITVVTRKKDTEDENVYEINSKSLDKVESVLRRVLPDMTNLPDVEKFSWVKKVIEKVEEKISIKDYDFIHTTGTPHSTHFIGKHFKEQYNIPWIAQFYDPWVDNNFRVFKIPLLKKLDEKQEANIAEGADLIIHTNSIIDSKWRERYGEIVKNKMFVLPLVTDGNLSFEKKTASPEKYTFLHAGGIYGTRTFKDFIEAILLLQKQEEKEVLNRILIKQIGYTNPVEIKRIKDLKLQDFFEFTGRSPYAHVITESEKADALILLDNTSEENFFFPSKLCEYFSFKRPILAVVPEKSEAKKFLKESGHNCVTPGNAALLAEGIKTLIKKESGENNFNPEYYKNFLPKKIALSYQLIVENHIHKKSP